MTTRDKTSLSSDTSDLLPSVEGTQEEQEISEVVLRDLETRIFYAETSLKALVASARLFRSESTLSVVAQAPKEDWRPERVKILARGFAAEWLRPDDPDAATPALLDTLQTAMLAFFACASRFKLDAPPAASPAVAQAPPCSGCGELMERVSYRCGQCGTFRESDADAVAQAPATDLPETEGDQISRLTNALNDCLEVIEPVRDEMRKQGKADAAACCDEVINYAKWALAVPSVPPQNDK
jgi:hypothetical protein